MKNLLEHEYSDLLEEDGGDRVAVDSFVVNEAAISGDGIPEITFSQFADAYKTGELQAVIIPKEYFNNKIIFTGYDKFCKNKRKEMIA